MKITCSHRDRETYAKGLCWPCYSKGWRVKRGTPAQKIKDGVWAAYRKKQHA